MNHYDGMMHGSMMDAGMIWMLVWGIFLVALTAAAAIWLVRALGSHPAAHQQRSTGHNEASPCCVAGTRAARSTTNT